MATDDEMLAEVAYELEIPLKKMEKMKKEFPNLFEFYFKVKRSLLNQDDTGKQEKTFTNGAKRDKI